MRTFKERLGREMLVLEGAMGTMLQKAGLLGDGAPEMLNLIEPDSISRIHSFYRLAGADCAITNTFGANRVKLAHYNSADLVEEINRKSIALARKGAAPYVLADIGPTGLVNDDFDEIHDVFFQQAKALASGGPDAFLLETFTDIAEIRCAILACRDADADLPIIASVSFGELGRMELSGTDPETAAVILESLGVDAIGLNCGLGPQQMEPLARAMRAATVLPIIVQPNAGMPVLAADGSTLFPGKPEDFSIFSQAMKEAGIAAVGSCCGSGPEFTAAIADEIFGAECIQPASISASTGNFGLRIASPQRTLAIGMSGRGLSPLRSIGERINPTGKPALKSELQEGKTTLVRSFAAEQMQAGADALDINVGVAGIDEPEALRAAVHAVAGAFPLPVAIDTTNPEALEAALKAYPGKALVNSVTGEQRSLQAVLPLVARYGAAVVVLALDDEGIPDTAQGRLQVVCTIRDQARKHGIADENLLVDSLVMAAAADKDAPRITLEAMQLIREELGLATLLGVSNVSHGLPNRALLNAAFLTAAAAGLDAAIVDPNNEVISEAIVLANSDREQAQANAVDTLAVFEQLLAEALKPQHVPEGLLEKECSKSIDQQMSVRDRLSNAIILGDSDGAPSLVDALIQEGSDPTEIIEDILTPAIQSLGTGFAEGTVFLPQLMVAADAMKSAVDQAKTYIPEKELDAGSAEGTNKRVVFATVKGDIHSIGKDICCSLLESQGVLVVNLGVDIKTEDILKAVREHQAGAVCLSALMTTTLPAMAESTKALQEEYPSLPILLGGAVVTEEWATQQGAYFEKDAPALAARIVELLR
ncbi:MAG: homocysteine S-methyltransferase family protein [Coriobacteriia bacterium]|nr:homocysteine S-methyltransferase family protein [Coriobacteriia bacterium]